MNILHGVLVGCDESQEWLLPWWWKNYSEENSFPVAFADFGMSEKAKEWCKERGAVLSIATNHLQVAKKGEIEPAIVNDWEKNISPFWELRQAWFKKPFALLSAPFDRTVWLDLDCEVLGPLKPLFEYIDPVSKMGLSRAGVREDGKGPIVYNSGVIVFAKDSPLLEKWMEASLLRNDRFLGDQDALSQVIFEGGYKVFEVPEIYNWLMCRGVHMGAVVLHWASQWGKEYIREHGGLKKSVKAH